MRYGIPEYRLPRDVLDSEIKELENLGVMIKTNKKVKSLDHLTVDEEYDAVLVAVGAHSGKKLPIPGADLEGVLMGLDFLKAKGAMGVGMSSWGPAIYAFGEDLSGLQNDVRAWLASNGGGECILTKANNVGMRVLEEQ